MTRPKVDARDVADGWRVPYDIVDEHGRLLFAKGQIAESETVRQRIADAGYEAQPSVPAPGPASRPRPTGETAYSRCLPMFGRLDILQRELLHGGQKATWRPRVERLALDLLGWSDANPDATLASIHLAQGAGHEVLHHALVAVLCVQLSGRLGWSAWQRQALTAAALTHDLGLMPASPVSGHDTGSADDGLPWGKLLHAHPVLTVRALRELGVDNSLWLDAVRHHHEFLDGSGYEGVDAASIGEPARLLAMADAVATSLRPRPTEDGGEARPRPLTHLYRNAGSRYARRMVTELVKACGLFPPGSVVRLASGEVAVVLRPATEPINAPEVAAVLDAAGQPLPHPEPRVTRWPEHSIRGVLEPRLPVAVIDALAPFWEPSRRPEARQPPN